MDPSNDPVETLAKAGPRESRQLAQFHREDDRARMRSQMSQLPSQSFPPYPVQRPSFLSANRHPVSPRTAYSLELCWVYDEPEVTKVPASVLSPPYWERHIPCVLGPVWPVCYFLSEGGGLEAGKTGFPGYFIITAPEIVAMLGLMSVFVGEGERAQ